MKKIVFSLAAFAALSLSAATRQDPPPTQVNIDQNCPATVTAGTRDMGQNRTGTFTENRSSTHDVRTTVTDRNGYSTSYHTGAGQTSTYDGYQGGSVKTTKNDDFNNNYQRGENRNVSKIDVTCSRVEK